MRNVLYCSIGVISLTLCSCGVRTPHVNPLLSYLEVKPDSIILDPRVSLDSRNLPHDHTAKKLALRELNARQRQLTTGRMKLFDSTSAIREHKSYLVSAMILVEGILSFAIYTESGYGGIMCLLNYRDTILVDYLACADDTEGNVVEEAEDHETIEGIQKWMEVRGDSVLVYSKVVRFESFFTKEQTLDRCIDSVVTVFKVDKYGRFERSPADSTKLD